MGLTALCPGTFDPVTNGHLDIIGRASETFESVVVGALENPSKQPMFSLEERVAMLKEACASMPNVTVVSFRGLLVDLAAIAGRRGDRQRPAGHLGLRVRDPDGADEPSPRGRGDPVHVDESEMVVLSSSLVKEVARLGGDVSGLVPDHVKASLADRLDER